MIIEQLPNGLNFLTTKRMNEQKDSWKPFVHLTEGSHLSDLFDWAKTIEGFGFWSEIAAANYTPYFSLYPRHEWVDGYPFEFTLYEDSGKLLVLEVNEDYIHTEVEETPTTTAYKESSGKLFYEIDWPFITQMAERMAANKKDGKYDLYNWKKPMNEKGLEDLKQAMLRHLIEILNGVYEDDGREFGHLESIACNALMLNYQLKNINK